MCWTHFTWTACKDGARRMTQTTLNNGGLDITTAWVALDLKVDIHNA